MSGTLRLTQVDAFADRPFAGNPAAVCLLPSPRDPAWMQQVTREMNLAETAFLLRPQPTASVPDLERGIGSTIRFLGRTAFDYLVELESEAQVRSRFFAPGAGIPEDPVTGSAHCGLAPYWASRLGKQEPVGYQASARGGTVQVRLEGDRVHLGGHAVTVVRGELLH